MPKQFLRRTLLAGAGAFVLDGSSSSTRLTPEQFVVSATQIRYWTFTADARTVMVGRFQAAGGSGNDIRVIVTDPDGFGNFRNGHTIQPLYYSGKVTVGRLNMRFPARGEYYLVFDNTFSRISPKEISSDLVLTYY